MNILGTRLSGLLKEQNLTQRDLAAKVGLTDMSICRYVTGKGLPKSETLAKIAIELNTTVEYLLGQELDEKYNFNTIKRMVSEHRKELTSDQKLEIIKLLL
ncbi:MAG: hypothetical protein ATN35_10265 [Epulopiscium sp. Nele67-Bin004]|nr:MAG: hypothetical protein ATN35_10265 [Epulopiscium sp. Nele67-Bin004]